MGLRDQPRHTVLVQLYEASAGTVGQKEWTPSGDPKPVRCNVHLQSVNEVVSFGTRDFVDGVIHVFPPAVWPGDEHSTIEYKGYVYDCKAPLEFDMSPSTAHTEIQITRQSKSASASAKEA